MPQVAVVVLVTVVVPVAAGRAAAVLVPMVLVPARHPA
jgi:hypothetical protein